MYEPLATAPKKGLWACLGVLLVGLGIFAVAATIVLALIPIYTSRGGSSGNSVTPNDLQFYAQYSADLDPDVDGQDSATGTVTNPDEIAQSSGISDQVQILDGQAQTTLERRRRRDTSKRRGKRAVKLSLLLRCVPKVRVTCAAASCLAQARARAALAIQNLGNRSSVAITVFSGGVLRRLRLTLVFVGTVFIRPSVGFSGEVSSLVFVATQSGNFTNASTWTNGTIPYGNCTVIIPAGITVVLARPILEIRMRQCDVFGTLVVGGGQRTFRWNFPLALTIHRGGVLLDLSAEKRMLIRRGSILRIFPGGGLGGSSSSLQVYSRSGSVVQELFQTQTIPSSGPFTCGILPSGTIIAENKILFIAIGIGSILSGGTFLGGIAPTAALCDAAGGCGLNIQPGADVSAEDLDDDFNINFDDIFIASGGTFAIGKPGSSKGIRFRFPFKLRSFGLLNFRGDGGNILIPEGSELNFLAGGGFRSRVAVGLQTFNRLTGLAIGTLIRLGTSFIGPIVYVIPIGGNIVITIGTTTTTPAVTGNMG